MAFVLLAGAALPLLREPAVRVGREVLAFNSYERVEAQAEAIYAAVHECGLEPELLAGMMFVESRGRLGAVSHKSALGLFQLLLPTARERARRLGVPEPSREDLLTDPVLNGRLAGAYLRWLDLRFDSDIEQMLIAYNTGPTRLKGWIREAGSYEAWRAERERAGNSDVLRYVEEVARRRDEFVRRGNLARYRDVFARPGDP